MGLIQRLKDWKPFPSPALVAGREDQLPRPGLYPYSYQGEGERSRIHLRIDPDHSGILVINAAKVIHLNPTAADMAYYVLEKTVQEEAIQAICRKYRVSKKQAVDDYTQTKSQIDELIRPDGACPICDLDLEVRAPFSARPSAPYRMDLALTYRCNNDCAHCYNARPRNYPELTTAQWKSIIDRCWQIGIPHIIFTGGEPTLRDDLPELVAYAESVGAITGINTNGRRLHDHGYLQALLDAGLDHVQITVESHDPEIHDHMVRCKGAWKQTIAGLRNVLGSRLYVMTNTTMLQENAPFLAETLDFLASVGVPKVGLNALIYSGKGKTVGTAIHESELQPLLEVARERTFQNGQELIWYTPTQYCSFDPEMLELGVKGCTAALYNMCVEPDGSLIPCQSYYQSLGSMLDDPWENLWNHPLALNLRERRNLPAKCMGCVLVQECGGGCPLLPGNNDDPPG